MATVKKKLKKFGRQAWELFKAALPANLMYFCAGLVLIMLCLRGEKAEWGATSITWAVICNVVVAGYNFLMAFASGTNHYEMLVSGNLKRMSVDEYGAEYKMSSHKDSLEYRPWKGFATGGFIALFPILFAILLGANQANVTLESMKNGTASLMLLAFVFSGWLNVPFFLMNENGIAISYFWGCLLAIIPVVLTGVGYILGAYAKRNKNLREQLIAQKMAEEEANRPKKINYGGLPGTKPKKKK